MSASSLPQQNFMESLNAMAMNITQNMSETQKNKLAGQMKDTDVGSLVSSFGNIMKTMGINIPTEILDSTKSSSRKKSSSSKQSSNIKNDDEIDTLSNNDISASENTSANINTNINTNINKNKKKKKSSKKKGKPLRFDIEVTLDELYSGKQKKITFERSRLDQHGRPFTEKKKLFIEIEKGMKEEDEIVIENEGDHSQGYDAGDVIVTLVVKEDENPTFQRDGDNLLMVVDISVYEVYNLDFEFKHLDGKSYRVVSSSGDVLHNNDGVRKLKGMGMPFRTDSSELTKFGDLFIQFNVVLGESVNGTHLELLKQIFPPLNSTSSSSTDVKSLEDITESDMEYFNDSDEDYSDSDDSEDLSEESEEEKSGSDRRRRKH